MTRTLAALTGSRREVVIRLRDWVVWLVTVFVFTIPFEDLVSIPAIGSPTRMVGLFAVGVAIVSVVSDGRVRVKAPTLFWLASLLFVLWNLVSFFWSRAPAATLSVAFTFVQLSVFVWLISEFCRSSEAMFRLMQAFVVGNLVAFVIVASEVLYGSRGFRDTGPFDANEFATVLALGIPLAAWLFTQKRTGLMSVVNLLYPLVAVFGVILAASRGGLVVTLVALAALPLMFAGIGMIQRALIIVLAVGSALVGFLYVEQAFPDLRVNLERLAGTGDELAHGTLTGRTVIWREAMRVFEQSPVLGVGSGAPRHVLAEEVFGRERAVHNVFLSIAAGTGVVGLLLFIFLIAIAALSTLQAEPQARLFSLLVLVALIIGMIPLTIELRKFMWFLLTLSAMQSPMVVGHESHRP